MGTSSVQGHGCGEATCWGGTHGCHHPPRVHSASSSCREVVAELEGSVAVQSPGPKPGGRRAGGARGAGLCGVSGIGVRTHGSTHRHADTGFARTLAGMRAQTCRTCTVACVLNMHAQTCAHAHTHAHARARTQPPASRVLSTRGQQTPTAARTRSPTPRLHTHAPSRVHANARTDPRVGARSHAQPTHTTYPPRPVHQTRHVSVGEEKRREETRRGGTGRPVGVASGCRASRVGMLTARPQAEPSRSGCGRCCATWMWPTKPSPAVTASRALPRTRIRTQPRPREENYSSQQALRHRGPAGAAPQSTLGAVVRAAILCPQRDGAARRGRPTDTRVCTLTQTCPWSTATRAWPERGQRRHRVIAHGKQSPAQPTQHPSLARRGAARGHEWVARGRRDAAVYSLTQRRTHGTGCTRLRGAPGGQRGKRRAAGGRAGDGTRGGRHRAMSPRGAGGEAAEGRRHGAGGGGAAGSPHRGLSP